jgi:hypothetical protein
VHSLTSNHNFAASTGLLVVSAHRWRGTLQRIVDGVTAFADAQPGFPVATSLAACSAVLAGDRARAAALLERLLARRPIVADDGLQAAELALATEACVLLGRQVPEQVITALRPFTGQMLVTSWGVDVPGAADRFLAIAAARAGERDNAAGAFSRAAELEAHISAVVPLRTQIWRHALLGDVTAPPVPPQLPGLEIERQRLTEVSPLADVLSGRPV